VTGTGGVVGTGGSPATGGVVGTGGSPATGGVVGTGGSPAAGGTGGFMLIGPIDKSSEQPLTPTLSWSPAEGATAYVVEVAYFTNFPSTDVFQATVDGSTTQITVPTGRLQAGAIYYWRVTAQKGNAQTIAPNAPRWFSSPYLVPGAHGLDVTPDDKKVVVASDADDGSIYVIDLGSRQVGAIPTGLQSHAVGLAVAPDGKHALATLVSNAADGVNGWP